MYTRAPSLGRGCRAQRGGVGFLLCGEAASSLPSPLGKGDRAAVDRVLSQTAYLRRFLFHLYHLLETIFPALFHTAPLSNLRPFGAPPSIGRREYPREPLPLEGAAERSEAGLASFLRRSRLLFAFPMRGKLCYPCAIIHNQHCPYEGKPKRRRKHPAPL